MSLWLFFFSFCVAILSGLGVGGGGLLSVILALFSDLPPLTVQGINLYFFLFSGGASLLIHLAKRRLRAGVIALCIAFGALGTLLGSAWAHQLGGAFTRKLFGGFLILTGISTLLRSLGPLFRRHKQEQKSETTPKEP